MTTSTLNFEINQLPKTIRKEIADFIELMKLKNSKKTNLKKRQFGSAKGKIKLSHDFDLPLNEFKEYMS